MAQVRASDLAKAIRQSGSKPTMAEPAKITPAGKPPVTLHRQRTKFFGWKPDLPDIRDRFMTTPRPQVLAALPPKATLTGGDKFLPPIRDQGEQGSCTGHSNRTATQYKRALEGKPALELSPRFIYYNARVIEGSTGEDSGAQIRDAVKGVAKLGVSSEALCPYSDKVYIQRPSAQAYKEALEDLVLQYERVDNAHELVSSQLQWHFKHCIATGNPVIFGFTVYANFMDDKVAQTGLMDLPAGSVEGGHAVCGIGYDDTKAIGKQTGGILVANSWGAEWGCEGPNGTRGYFWMPWKYLLNRNLCDDMWAIDVVKK